MIALDTSVVAAIALDEPRRKTSSARCARGGPDRLADPVRDPHRPRRQGVRQRCRHRRGAGRAPNVTALPFDRKHYAAAEAAFDRYGKGRHPAGLNMGDCFAYAVAAVSRAPFLFKGGDFGRTDILRHPASAIIERGTG